jgi:hypothetical protein
MPALGRRDDVERIVGKRQQFRASTNPSRMVGMPEQFVAGIGQDHMAPPRFKLARKQSRASADVEDGLSCQTDLKRAKSIEEPG